MRYLKTNNSNWKRLCKGELESMQLEINIKNERVKNLEKPIFFNTEMVKAILEGRKTCTRRIMKPQPKLCNHNEYEGAEWKDDHTKWVNDGDNWYCALCGNGVSFATTKLKVKGIRAPFQIEDILYVRETWCDVEKDFRKDDDIELGDCKYIYKVDDNGEKHPLIEGYIKRWRPSIHMPKKAARIFLKVTSVRLERLQDITHEQILKEGTNVIKSGYDRDDYEFCWINLWEPTCTKEEYRWNNNPWVWVIDFEKIKNN